MKYYLAVDIGASSGRHMLAHMENGKIVLEEVYRFYNGNDLAEGHRVWDTERLFREVVTGMRKCKEAGKIPVSMGIDTWAVDYVLLDENDKRLGPCYAYRDARTNGCDEAVYSIVPKAELYRRTGIQRAIFNTIFQLEADKEQEPERLTKAESLLMVPDYLDFLLTGVKKQEYTNASTTGLLDAKTGDWDRDLIGKLGFPDRLFGPLSEPGTVVGNLLPEVQEQCGFDTTVVLVATHDTGSAVMSVPAAENTTDFGNAFAGTAAPKAAKMPEQEASASAQGTSEPASVLYISSGTWSLMGTELRKANCSPAAEGANFTNEGGYEHRYRFLKNIMGLWMIQEARKEFLKGWNGAAGRGNAEYEADDACSVNTSGKQPAADFINPEQRYSFAALCAAAEQETIDSIVNCDDERFLAPASMAGAVQDACRESGQEVPETPAAVARVIYRSLAVCYDRAAREIGELTGQRFDTIHIIGGGSNADFLNRLTAERTGKKVLAGPGEATAIGNIGAQMIRDGVFTSLQEFRRGVGESFDVRKY